MRGIALNCGGVAADVSVAHLLNYRGIASEWSVRSIVLWVADGGAGVWGSTTRSRELLADRIYSAQPLLTVKTASPAEISTNMQ